MLDLRLKHNVLDAYSMYMHTFDFDYVKVLIADLYNNGFTLNKQGQLFYSSDFVPLLLNYELLFVRHGETYGNCGQVKADGVIDRQMVVENKKDSNQRIFQGNVNNEINQLTTLGWEQAKKLVPALEGYLSNNWIPDVIFYSPLKRARDTALPFVEKNNFHDRFIKLDSLREMSFGAWDNRRVCDFKRNDLCHQFYQEHNALVKKSGVNGNGEYEEGENFVELLLRAKQVLIDLNAKYANQKILMFSHSMFGAASKFLLGKGQEVEKHGHLAFDGAYILPCATPISLWI